MSKEILKKLEELKTGQDGIVERPGRLESTVGTIESTVGTIESTVGTIAQDLMKHRQDSSDNFETVLSTLKALGQKLGSDGNPPSRLVSTR